MKESAQIAYTVAKSFLTRVDPDNTFLQKAQLHLHVPEVSEIYGVIPAVITGVYSARRNCLPITLLTNRCHNVNLYFLIDS